MASAVRSRLSLPKTACGPICEFRSNPSEQYRGRIVGVGARLNGPRVLIVEDEAMIAALLESILVEAGCSIVGPVPTVNRAMETIERDKIDVAVLDVHVNGDEVYPIVDRLLKSHIPIVFVSGYSQQDLRAGYRHQIGRA